MSSIGSISGSAQGLYQFIQRLNGGLGSSATSAAQVNGSTAAAGPADPDGDTSSGTSATQASGRHHRVHHGGPGKFFKEVSSAVSDALNAAKSSGSTEDPNKIVEDTIANLFKSGKLKAPTSQPGGAPPSAGASGSRGADGDHDGSGSTTTKAGGSGAQQAFSKLLQSFGIDGKQFRNDFLAAVKDAQGGGTSTTGAALKSLPPGSVIDQTA